jgi:hypothetical protein
MKDRRPLPGPSSFESRNTRRPNRGLISPLSFQRDVVRAPSAVARKRHRPAHAIQHHFRLHAESAWASLIPWRKVCRSQRDVWAVHLPCQRAATVRRAVRAGKGGSRLIDPEEYVVCDRTARRVRRPGPQSRDRGRRRRSRQTAASCCEHPKTAEHDRRPNSHVSFPLVVSSLWEAIGNGRERRTGGPLLLLRERWCVALREQEQRPLRAVFDDGCTLEAQGTVAA